MGENMVPARRGTTAMATFRDIVDNAKLKEAMAAVLPKHMTPDRIIKLMIAASTKTPGLNECTPPSIIACMMACSETGLEPGGVLGQAYVIPYGKTATFLIGYRGMLELARRSGKIVSIESRVVYRQDHFKCEYGVDSKLEHRPNFEAERNDKDIIAAYAVAKLTDGGICTDVMTRPEVDAIRKRSKAGNNGPWVTDFGEMARKTVIRRLFKYLPTSTEQLENGEFINRVAVGFEREDDSQGYLDGQRAQAAVETLKPGRQSTKPAAEKVDKTTGEVTTPFDKAEGIVEIAAYVKTEVDLTAFDLAVERMGKTRENWSEGGDGMIEKLLSIVRDLKNAQG